jgi:hypothetical protein
MRFSRLPHGHFEVASRQDVETQSCAAPVLAAFRSKLTTRTSRGANQLHGSRHRALNRMQETEASEEGQFSAEDLPLLAKSIWIVEDGCTVWEETCVCPKSP